MEVEQNKENRWSDGDVPPGPGREEEAGGGKGKGEGARCDEASGEADGTQDERLGDEGLNLHIPNVLWKPKGRCTSNEALECNARIYI